MSDRIQIALSLASLALVAFAGFLVFRSTREPIHEAKLDSLPVLSQPEAVTVWTAQPRPDVLMLFKPNLDSQERGSFHDKTLSRRLGAPDDAYRFFELVVVNGSPSDPFELSVHEIAVGNAQGRWTSIAADHVLERGAGALTDADRIVVRALGLRSDSPVVPAWSASLALIAFPGDVPEAADWTSCAIDAEGHEIPMRREVFDRTALDRFLLEPSLALGARSEVDLAKRPAEDPK